MTEADRIVEALKQVLREQGIAYRQLAAQVGVSEATIKRSFSRKTFTLDRLQQICDVVGISLHALSRRAATHTASEIYRLSRAQERRLVADVELFYFFWMLVHRHSVASICRRYRISDRKRRRWLVELDRMKILDLREGDRFTLNVPANVVWNEDGPIERLIVSRSVPVFLRRRFSRSNEYFRFVVGKLSPESMAVFRTQLEAMAERVFQQSVGTDAMRPDSQTAGLLVAFGPADFSLRDVVSGPG